MSENVENRSFEQVLINIDETLDNASAVPFSSKKMVDAELLHQYVDEIRLNIPGEIKRAREMTRERQAIMDKAQNEADELMEKAKEAAKKIIDDAKAEADRLVSEQEIVGRANEYAEAQVQRANEDAADIINQAREKEKAIRAAMVSNINDTLSQAVEVLQKNLDAVSSTKETINKIAE